MRMNDPAEGLNVCAARGSIEPIRLAAMTTPIGGQRRSPAPRRGRGLPGAIRGFLWPTELLLFSDFLIATPHAHSALQLSVGLSGAPRVQLDDAWQQALWDWQGVENLEERTAAPGWIDPRVLAVLRSKAAAA